MKPIKRRFIGGREAFASLLRRGIAVLSVLCAAGIGLAISEARAGPKQTLAKGATLEIIELRRINEKVVQLKYTIANQTDKAMQLNRFGLVGGVGSSGQKASGVRLVDFDKGKVYFVGSARECLCSWIGRGRLEVPARSQREFWAQFAAPPKGVEKIAVLFGSTPPLTDVPIGR